MKTWPSLQYSINEQQKFFKNKEKEEENMVEAV